MSHLGSSFSFGPQNLVDSYLDGNASTNSLQLDPNRSILPSSPLRSSPRRQQHRRKQQDSISGKPHPLASASDIFDESQADDADDEEDSYEWGMVDRMRLWRHDALMQHLYDTAAFWGDKIVSWTNDPNDAFWLAQTYFMTHQYARAERLLTRPFSTSPPKKQLKGKSREHDVVDRLPVGPTGMLQVPESLQEGISRLVDMSVACRYLAAQCQIRQGNWEEATELLGEANPFRDSGRSGPSVPNMDGGIKIEASMCHLRGLLMLKLNRGDQAKQCFMEALALDVKCFDAFEQLVRGEMMGDDEEWEFVQNLAYSTQCPEDAAFVQMMYTTRLRKYKHAAEHALTRQRLVDEYGLGDNPDVLFSFADALYVNCRWSDCFVVTSRILELVSIHTPTLPLHIACMFHLSHLNSNLFILAHSLVQSESSNPLSWYAVGIYYLAKQKYQMARQYLSKTSLMDPRFAPAWIAFAHTFSMEGESEHAVIGYSTCARMFNGSHLPLCFVGMEMMGLSRLDEAEEAFTAAYSMCNTDPLLVNERGVMKYNRGEYQQAVELFQEAIRLADVTQSSQMSWATTYLNLGTCYRKLQQYQPALDAYQKVLELDPRHKVALAFMGMVYHLMGNVDKAIVKYHEALSIDPINAYVMELLNLALESSASAGLRVGTEEIDKVAQALKVKYEKAVHTKEIEAKNTLKGKERQEPDVPQDVRDDRMSLG